MRRRELIALFVGAGALPIAARAQQVDRMRRVGMLTGFPQGDSIGQSLLAAFRQQLTTLGWIEGRNISFQIRWAGTYPEQLRAYGAELARMMPDAIVVYGSRTLTAVRQETDYIPIVFTSISDPVASGYVKSLGRPGGNVTGFTSYSGTPSPKLLEMLKEAAPSVTRVAFMTSPLYPGLPRQFQALQSASSSFAVSVTAMSIHDPTAITRTIADFAQEPNGGLVVTSDVSMVTHRDQIVAPAARYRLPAIYQDRAFVEAGGLMSYSIDRRESYRRAALHVDRILKGEKPADLPVQQPTKFELALNLKTAKTLGLTVPRIILLRAENLIE
jgi:putative ABC transport system substrate-binding protein